MAYMAVHEYEMMQWRETSENDPKFAKIADKPSTKVCKVFTEFLVSDVQDAFAFL